MPLLHRNQNLSPGAAVAEIAQGFRDIAQGISFIDHRLYNAGLDHHCNLQKILVCFDQQEPQALSHGYGVEARIVIWEDEDALIIPSSALFRDHDQWAVFEVRRGKARLTPVEVAQNNGIDAAVAGGFEDGATIILYPGSDLVDGESVTARNGG